MPKKNTDPLKFEVVFNYDTFFKVAQSYPHGPKLAQLTVPYDQNSFVSLVKFPYEGKKLAAYAEEMSTTIYLHMETKKR